MNLYQLPQIKPPKIKFPKPSKFFWILVLSIFLSSFCGFLAGIISSGYFYSLINSPFNVEVSKKEPNPSYLARTSHEEAIIQVVKKASPAVVSIVVSKDVPIIERYFRNPFEELEPFFGPLPFKFRIPEYRQRGFEKKEVAWGTGFIVSEDGLVLTNKHVVSETDAEYTVFTVEGKKFPARVLARDPFQDIAILKIEKEGITDKEGNFVLKPFPTLKLGDSDKLEIGQTVIAIGNVLGEFRNSVSVGVISGLGRTITASGGGLVETLEDVIQTDAAVNRGNSGGPLLNLQGEVVGVNTAMVLEAQNIGFAIPINKAKKDIEQVKKFGKIIYPFLGIRYIIVTEEIQKENNLPVNYGAWIVGGPGEPGVVKGSAADKAGLKEGDIILEFNGEKITSENSLAKIIRKYNPGDKVVLKLLRGKEIKTLEVVLEERTSE